MRRCSQRGAMAIAAVIGLGVLAACEQEVPPQEVPKEVNEPAVSSDLCRLPAQPPSPAADMAAFSEYAWKLFVALNWPADPAKRGAPNCDASFGSEGPTVWETYKTSDELFLPRGADPGPWQTPVAPQARKMRSMRFIAKAPVGALGAAGVGESREEAIRQAVGGWLIDRHGRPTYYLIAVNETLYDYVYGNRYYDAAVVNEATSVSFPTGSLEIKASWRVLDPSERSRYATVEAEVMQFDANGQPTGQFKNETIGLVGLHIVYKAAGFPQWIWATFEHEDNAPDAGAVDESKNWSYFDPNCSGPYCEPNTSPIKGKVPFGTANQLTRITPIRPATVAANEKWRKQLAGTVFANYVLVSPQWPTEPNNPGNPQGSPTPATVANLTMESYIQPTSSCMDCHSTARVPDGDIKSNYSFLFVHAKSSR